MMHPTGWKISPYLWLMLRIKMLFCCCHFDAYFAKNRKNDTE